jgi:hypothetical protein
MDPRNLINFSNSDEDRQIYRIVTTERLYQLFADGENVLVRPSKWDDPFENFVLNARGRMNDGRLVQFGFNNDFYGQCWTLQRASDAMWRIYSPKQQSIRIRTTVKKLWTSLTARLGEWAHVQAFIGRVRYLPTQKLIAFANTVLRDGLSPTALAGTLLVKRPAFIHEKEVRLLYLEKDKTPESDVFAYKIDPNALIDQIMTDPRLSHDEANTIESEIRKKTGYRGAIKRSLLYAPPRDLIFPIGG